jgi:hypothetical protein
MNFKPVITRSRYLLHRTLFTHIEKINGRRLVGTTLLKGDERRHVLLRGGETSYLTDETWGRHVLVVCVKWQNGTDRQIDR